MKITMLHTRRGSEDGFSVKEYEAGQEYDIVPSLAFHFLRSGWAYNSEPEPIDPGENASPLEKAMYALDLTNYNRRTEVVA